MNTNDLEAFLAVVETGSLVAAARRLNLTQPGVTRRVQNLEDRLGVTLFERPAKPLRPTLAGREAYEHGRRVIQSIEELMSGAAPNGAIRGELRIGVSIDLSEQALLAPVDALRARFPDLTVRLTAGWAEPLMEQVLRNQIDAAAIGLPVPAQPADGIAADALATTALVIAASPDIALPDSPRLSELAGHAWIVSQDGCGYRTVLRRRFEAEGLNFTVGVEAPDPELRLSLAARGLGLTVTKPERLARSRWRDRLKVVAVPDFTAEVRSWVVSRPAPGRLHRPIALFRDTLREALSAGLATNR